jgi:hypothetical protein
MSNDTTKKEIGGSGIPKHLSAILVYTPKTYVQLKKAFLKVHARSQEKSLLMFVKYSLTFRNSVLALGLAKKIAKYHQIIQQAKIRNTCIKGCMQKLVILQCMDKKEKRESRSSKEEKI